MDTIVVSILLIIPLLFLTLTPNFKKAYLITGYALKTYFLTISSLIVVIEFSTFPFLLEYDVRPNYLFVEYLVYPREVITMLLKGHLADITAGIYITGVFIFLFVKYIRFDLQTIFKTDYIKRLVLIIPIGLLLFIGIRSSFGHRPANISDAMHSSNRILNEITKNSIYSIGYAVYLNRKNNSDIGRQYGKMDEETALKRMKNRLNIQSENSRSPFQREEKTHFKTETPRNLVIFIQESMGAQFVEAVGGESGITPNLNRLSTEGVLLKNVFSNGTRSIRGLAGCVAGNFSIPGEGVVKRNKSQTDFFSIASLLKPKGYQTLFFYGGESRFDNMKGWFYGNGFDRIIDEPAFVNAKFKGTWGVSDGDVVNRANEEFKKLYSQNQKFAAVIFSTSNHDPFDFPEDSIDLVPGEPVKSVKNAIKYADSAIGDFIEKARHEPYYQETVFVIIADHNVRVYGDDIVPVNMFHIPALILGGNIKPFVYDKLTSQPDVLATALDLTGLDLNYPIMGHSVFSENKPELSFLKFNNTYALRVKDSIAVLRPYEKPFTFLYKESTLKPTLHDTELEKDLLAFITGLDFTYQNRLYN